MTERNDASPKTAGELRRLLARKLLDTNAAPKAYRIVRGAAPRDYRFSSLVSGIVSSAPFQMRITAPDREGRPGVATSASR